MFTLKCSEQTACAKANAFIAHHTERVKKAEASLKDLTERRLGRFAEPDEELAELAGRHYCSSRSVLLESSSMLAVRACACACST